MFTRNSRKILIGGAGIAIGAMALLLFLGLRSPSTAKPQAVPLSFHNPTDLIEFIQKRTPVPVYLPTTLPAVYAVNERKSTPDNPVYYSSLKAWAGAVQANRAGYRFSIDYAKNCEGANFCSAGFISASVIDETVLPLSEILQDPDQVQRTQDCQEFAPEDFQRRPKLETVTLTGGVEAVVVPYSCGASFGATQVIWDKDGYRYALGLKHGTRQDVVTLANSALQNGPQ